MQEGNESYCPNRYSAALNPARLLSARLRYMLLYCCFWGSKYSHFIYQFCFDLFLGIENSKSVIEAGLLIQSEAATYILTYTNLVQSLCCKQLVMSWQKITDLEKIIGKKINLFLFR